jgi:shikimate kinase
MKNIALIGFMGSGKTAVSRALAKKLKRKITDTDAVVEKRARMKIKKIFAKYGEARFRKMETSAAKYAAGQKNAIIATGGGIVTGPGNVRALRKSCLVVYLKNSFAISAKRLKGKKDRPLFDHENLGAAKALFAKRQGLYKKAAHVTVVTDKKTIAQAVNEIIKKAGL